MNSKNLQKQTFSTFIVGTCNAVAHDICVSIAQSPGANVNPLFITGPSGNGKTHLLNAISYEIKKQNPYFRIWHLNAEKFCIDISSRAKKNSLGSYPKESLDQYDALFFEDIFMLKKLKIFQAELFQLLNEFADHGRQVVDVRSTVIKKEKSITGKNSPSQQKSERQNCESERPIPLTIL